jgi:hypothetical protein
VRSLTFLGVSLAAFAFAGSAGATPFVPRDRITEMPGTPAQLPLKPTTGVTVQDILSRLALVTQFEQTMQYTGAVADAEASFGGIIEVESGTAHSIVESDNTQEAIWIWSWQDHLTGKTTYATQVTNAFEYLAGSPGYTEWQDTGDTGPDYYSFYNCGWGLRAVTELEAATGDKSHHMYGDLCASHIADNAMLASNGQIIDATTIGWAASGLWLWAHAQGDAALEQKAVDLGGQVKAWIDAAPPRVGDITSGWATTGAAAFDGVVGSYMKAHPSELGPWVQQVAPHLGGWIDESMMLNPEDWLDWRNAWAAWNMLAQFDAAAALGEGPMGMHTQVAMDIFGKLWAQDTDGDGAIPGSQQLVSAELDESWITAYFVYFGMQNVLAGLEQTPDGGAEPGQDSGSSGDDGGGAVDASQPEGSDVDSGNGAGPPSGSGGGKGCACDDAGGPATADLGVGLLLAAAVGVGLGRGRLRKRRA